MFRVGNIVRVGVRYSTHARVDSRLSFSQDGRMTQPDGPMDRRDPAVPPAYPAGVQPGVATPSRLSGRKLLLLVLGLIGGCGLLALGALAVAAVLGVKIFEAVR
jgi:hypothetical protein